MKFNIFISSLVILCFMNTICTSKNAKFSTNSVINLLFEMLRGLILNGDVEKDLPGMDPLMFDVHQFPLHGLFVKGELNITDGVLTGLGRFNIEKYEFSADDLLLDIEITIPRLKLEADYYELDGNVFGVLPFSGIGIFYGKLDGITINTKIYFKKSDDERSILIDRLEKTKFTISEIVSLTEYDKNIDNVLNAIIHDCFPAKLSRFSAYIAAQYQDELVAALNPMMAAYDTWSILASIL